jgi:hypothetical protein
VIANKHTYYRVQHYPNARENVTNSLRPISLRLGGLGDYIGPTYYYQNEKLVCLCVTLINAVSEGGVSRV